ncbi:MAG: serine/threonine protein kinase [Oscillospiraceae bacterium]|nr:serine/threonine protein kinase [Oscillospiraceae bacterium]
MTTFQRQYLQITQINKGGTGVIYRAYHQNLGKYVILKQITLMQDISFVRREVDILKNLRHRFLPVIYDFINVEGNWFIVEDFIDGTDMNHYIKNKTFIPEPLAIKWLHQMCEVLEYLHTRRPAVFHSDIKPGNIMIDANGDICLIDFNISVLCGDRVSVLGYSNYYCAPEQIAKANDPRSSVVIDARTDIYSTAATFYSLLSGIVPSAQTPNRPLAQMRLPYSEGLMRLLDRAMLTDMSKRWQSAAQMSSQLNHLKHLTAKAQKAKKRAILLFIVGVIIAGLGVICTACGVHVNKIAEIESSISRVNSRYETEGVSDSLIEEIQAILSDKSYSSVLRQKTMSTAQLYRMLGEHQYNMDTQSGYASAGKYYGKAWDLIQQSDASDSVKREYAVNYVMALAVSGDSVGAQSIADAYIYGYDELTAIAVKVQLAYSRGEYDNVLSLAAEIPEGRDQVSVRSRLYKIIAAAAEKNFPLSSDDMITAAGWLKKAADIDPSDATRRYAASYCMNLGNILSDETYYIDAARYYESIIYQTDEDKVNYAELQAVRKKYSESLSLLNDINSFDPVLLCKINYIKAMDFAGLGRFNDASDYCYQTISSYNMLNEKQREKIDVQAIRHLMQQIGIDGEIF